MSESNFLSRESAKMRRGQRINPADFEHTVTEKEFEKAKAGLRRMKAVQHFLSAHETFQMVTTLATAGIMSGVYEGTDTFANYQIKKHRTIIRAYHYQQNLEQRRQKTNVTFPGGKEFSGHNRFMPRSGKVISFPGNPKPPENESPVSQRLMLRLTMS